MYHILKDHGITNWRAKKRPELTEAHAKARLQWALENRHRTDEEWAQIIWSDECSVEKGAGKRPTWVFRMVNEKWDKKMIDPCTTGKALSQMIWAAFSGVGGSSEIYVLERDFESKKHGYSAKSYLDCLKEMMPQIWRDDLSFMHDNARIHTAGSVKTWLDENCVKVISWPARSPDLNPIEHAWARLKQILPEVDPDLDQLTGESEAAREHLIAVIREAWRRIPRSYWEALWKSMGRRCEAVIAAKGWHTKY
jgi:hypothetical protein